METTNKQNMVRIIASKTGMMYKEVLAVLECEHETIINEVKQGRKVAFRGFGEFKPKLAKAKTVQDINRGKTFVVPAKVKPVFKPSPKFGAEVEDAQL